MASEGHVIGYASRTGTRTTLAAMRGAGWGVVVTPGSHPAHPVEGMPYMLDNGAWSAHLTGKPWDAVAFAALVFEHGRDAAFIVAPDIVEGGQASLLRSLPFLDWLWRRTTGHVLLPVQDGIEVDDVRYLVGGKMFARVGLFVGGSTEWKEATLPMWGNLARERECYLHVGRVNTARRIRLCQDAGADSVDGTSVTCFPKTLPMLDGAVRQLGLFT